MDGVIENSSPRALHNYASGSQGKEIRIGWNHDGSATRGFLSFDLTSILPVDDSELVIEKADFRIQFTGDSNISNTNTIDLDGSTWNIFSGDEDDYDEGTTDFRTKLVITYHHEKN